MIVFTWVSALTRASGPSNPRQMRVAGCVGPGDHPHISEIHRSGLPWSQWSTNPASGHVANENGFMNL